MIVAEEPRRRLGGVARVGVLRKNDDEAALEPEVESGEEERQRRLRDTGARPLSVGDLHGEAFSRLRDLVRERLKPLAVGELLRDDV